ncbi:hypothetical protein ACFXSN_004900, partial [Salmonella enterica subsp. enterica serovar Chester]
EKQQSQTLAVAMGAYLLPGIYAFRAETVAMDKPVLLPPVDVGVRHIGAVAAALVLAPPITASRLVRVVVLLTITLTQEPLSLVGVALMGFASSRSLCNEYIIRCY